MNSNSKTARIVGVLFLIAMGTSLLGINLLESILNAPDYLINVSANSTHVILGALLEFICAIAIVGIAVMMFPILKKHNEALALGYVGFRIIESVATFISDISPLSRITLSQDYVQAGAPDASYFQTLGTLSMAESFWANEMLAIAFGLGALIFYYLLYKSKLIPRFISVWGLIGVTLQLTGSLLDMFGHSAGMIIYLPIISNEIFLAIWLIVKGFNSSAIASASALTDIN